jgi:hypothetical protein
MNKDAVQLSFSYAPACRDGIHFAAKRAAGLFEDASFWVKA